MAFLGRLALEMINDVLKWLWRLMLARLVIAYSCNWRM